MDYWEWELENNVCIKEWYTLETNPIWKVTLDTQYDRLIQPFPKESLYFVLGIVCLSFDKIQLTFWRRCQGKH